MKIDAKKNTLFLSVELFLLSVAAGWIIWTATSTPDTENRDLSIPHEGFRAPDFALQDISGIDYQLSDYAGNVIILNFWASWCPPCKEEMEALNSTYRKYSEQGLILLSINMTSQDNIEDVIYLSKELSPSFPILLDKTGEAAVLYQVIALPTTIFVNQDGVIERVVVGGPLTATYLASTVENMLGD
jgi:thiol-disulfide isomerase/thioredoxin